MISKIKMFLKISKKVNSDTSPNNGDIIELSVSNNETVSSLKTRGGAK